MTDMLMKLAKFDKTPSPLATLLLPMQSSASFSSRVSTSLALVARLPKLEIPFFIGDNVFGVALSYRAPFHISYDFQKLEG